MFFLTDLFRFGDMPFGTIDGSHGVDEGGGRVSPGIGGAIV
jgi:hypothetical protein